MYEPFLRLYGPQGPPPTHVRLRVNFLESDGEPGVPGLRSRLANSFPFFGNDLIRTGAIGEFIADLEHYAGGNDTWMNAARAIAEAGWRAEVHSITDTDFQTEIEGFEKIKSSIPIDRLRWVVAHATYITPDYVERLRRVGGGVNVAPLQYFGATAPAGGPPYRQLMDSGIPLGLSSDGMQIAPMNPWVHAYYATTGLDAAGHDVNSDQRLTRQEFLDGYTISNRWFLDRDDEARLGSIEEGRLADIAVLNADYFSVDDADLRSIHSTLTTVGGVVVHEGPRRMWADVTQGEPDADRR